MRGKSMIPDYEQIAAGFLVVDKKVLIAQRNENGDEALKWEFPGGKLNADEKYDEALIREFKEEFGIDIEVTKEIGSIESNSEKIRIFTFFLVEGDHTGITLNVHKEKKFVSLDELKTSDLCSADKLFIEKWEADLKQYID